MKPYIFISGSRKILQKARNNEETYDIIYRRSHPVLWSAFYYSIVFVPIAVLTYRGRYYNVFVDQVGLDQDAIMYKNITKRSVRILITILFNLLALVVLFLTDERVQEIARSIRCELSGVKCADNLGWLSFRLNALSQSIKGDYSSLNTQSCLAEALPISWIHNQYSVVALMTEKTAE